ncbi:hypothetical protein L7F22_025415 [Adiantum nelumboides]|nr:hypothetical protein [Adiantum nelumboides]
MYKTGMVADLPAIMDLINVCEACMMGKQHWQPFPQEASRAKAPLELVHTNLCGKMNTTALRGSSYFMMLIDDYSRRTWVYFLKGKDEAFAKFKEWHVLVEKETGNKLKKLRSDRDGEFTSSEFVDYCKQHGIKRHLTTPHTPQQNGVAERKNRIIVEMARSMIKAKGLPDSFWAEAVNTAVYILNRSYTKAVKDMTTKWNAKSQKCIFLGYNEESKGYRLYNPTTKKIVISRDVVFAEQPHHEEEDEDSSFENQEIPTYESQPPTAKQEAPMEGARCSVRQTLSKISSSSCFSTIFKVPPTPTSPPKQSKSIEGISTQAPSQVPTGEEGLSKTPSQVTTAKEGLSKTPKVKKKRPRLLSLNNKSKPAREF